MYFLMSSQLGQWFIFLQALFTFECLHFLLLIRWESYLIVWKVSVTKYLRTFNPRILTIFNPGEDCEQWLETELTNLLTCMSLDVRSELIGLSEAARTKITFVIANHILVPAVPDHSRRSLNKKLIRLNYWVFLASSGPWTAYLLLKMWKYVLVVLHVLVELCFRDETPRTLLALVWTLACRNTNFIY